MSASKNKLLPVYAIVGSDKLKSKYVLERLEKRLSEFGDLSFNSSTFEGSEATDGQIVSACMQLPFNSEKRYVLVKNADKLNKSETESIIKYLENPTTSTILALIYNKLAKNTRIYKSCANISSTAIIDCSPPKKYQIAQGLSNVAKSHGGSIDIDAANKLVELIGEDTLHLDAEIQKMLLANGGNNIDINQVENQILKSSDVKPWDFTNAFADRDLNKCLELLNNIPDSSLVFMLSQTTKIIKELICVHDLGQGATQNAISQELGLDGWRVKNHFRWAYNFSKKELLLILQNALECDKKMKSTANSALSFEKFVIESLRIK